MIIPDWLFQEPLENEIKRIYNPKHLKQVARDNIELDDQQLIKVLDEKMNNPYYFFDGKLTVGFNITPESHHINHAISNLINKPSYPGFGIEVRNLHFYQGQKKWKHNLTPIEVSKKDSHRVIDLLIHKKHLVLIKILFVFLGDHYKNFICRRCLNSYTSENMLMIQKPNCENNDITTLRTSSESHLQWKKHFHKNPLYFRIYEDFEVDNEIDNSSVGNKTTIIFKQNPILDGYIIISELNDVLESGYYTSPLGFNNVDWFVNGVINLENKMASFFKNTKNLSF